MSESEIEINHFKYFNQYSGSGPTSWRFWNSIFVGVLYFMPTFGICVEVMHHIYHTITFAAIAFQLGISIPVLAGVIMSMMIIGTLLYAIYRSLEQYHTLKEFFKDENELNFNKIRLTSIVTIYSRRGIAFPKDYNKKLNSVHEAEKSAWHTHIMPLLGLVLHVVIGDLALASNFGGLIHVNLFSFTAIWGPFSPVILLLGAVILNLGVAIWIHGAVDFESEHHHTIERQERDEIEAQTRIFLADIDKIKEICTKYISEIEEMLRNHSSYSDEERQEKITQYDLDYQNKMQFLNELKEVSLISSENSTEVDVVEYDPTLIYVYDTQESCSSEFKQLPILYLHKSARINPPLDDLAQDGCFYQGYSKGSR